MRSIDTFAQRIGHVQGPIVYQTWENYGADDVERRAGLATRGRSRATTRLRRAHSFGSHKHEIRSASHNVSRSLDSSVDHVVGQRNEKAAWWLANYFGQKRTAQTHQSPWKMADANLAVEQSLICITWFKDASDLLKLTTVTETYDPDDPHGYRRASVAEAIGSYGQIALPYLHRLLQNSRQMWVRTSTAKALASMNDPDGFQFFIAMLKDKPFYTNELIGWLKDTFPTLKTADASRTMAFLKIKSRTPISQLVILLVINYFESEPASDSTRIVALAWTLA